MNSEKKTKLCKKYISQIKCFFPVIRQNEKKYINYISTSVNDYCIDNPDAAIEDLYNIFGSPQETINSYMSENPDNIVPYFKKINVKKWIIRILTFSLIAFLIVTSASIWYYHRADQIFEYEKNLIEQLNNK